MFLAREAGPEMVGTMGNKTTIANNEQIVEGIRQGVFDGVIEAMMMQSATQPEGAVIEIPLRIGNEELARAVYKGNESLIRRGELIPQFI